jgi:hypothetical protein
MGEVVRGEGAAHMSGAAWTAEEDAALEPYITGLMPRSYQYRELEAQLGRSKRSIEGRLRVLRGDREGEADGRRSYRPRGPGSLDILIKAGQAKQRRCLACRALFYFDAERANYFLCDTHRGRDASPYEPGTGGHTGRRAPRLHA